MKGFSYIAFLLQHPHQTFPVLKLVKEVDGIPLPVDDEVLSKMSEERWAEDGLSISSLREARGKAYSAVKNNITRSLTKIQQYHPAFTQHLD